MKVLVSVLVLSLSSLSLVSLILQLKRCIVKAFVRSIALYGSELCTLKKRDVEQLKILKCGYGVA